MPVTMCISFLPPPEKIVVTQDKLEKPGEVEWGKVYLLGKDDRARFKGKIASNEQEPVEDQKKTVLSR